MLTSIVVYTRDTDIVNLRKCSHREKRMSEKCRDSDIEECAALSAREQAGEVREHGKQGRRGVAIFARTMLHCFHRGRVFHGGKRYEIFVAASFRPGSRGTDPGERAGRFYSG